jgi:hypothetical protein
MIWNNDLSKWLVSAQNHVAALLAFHIKASLSQSLDTIPS